MLKTFKKTLYRIHPRFPEDVQFAKRIVREQVALLSQGQNVDQVAPQLLDRLQPLQQRGYSQLHIQVICAEAIQHLLIEKVLREQKAMLS
jgi:hypothetical protein